MNRKQTWKEDLEAAWKKVRRIMLHNITEVQYAYLINGKCEKDVFT